MVNNSEHLSLVLVAVFEKHCHAFSKQLRFHVTICFVFTSDLHGENSSDESRANEGGCSGHKT